MPTTTLNLVEDKATALKVFNIWLRDQPEFNGEFSIIDYTFAPQGLALKFKNHKNFDEDVKELLTTRLRSTFGF